MFLKNLPFKPFGSFGFSKCIALLVLNVLSSSSNTFAGVIPGKGDGKICGEVITSAGKTLLLREGVPLTDSEFKSVQTGKMSGAKISPITESNCAINVCGFTSWGAKLNKDYIGTTSDYGDCQLIKGETKADAPIYTSKFNTSSLSCGCLKDDEECLYQDCNLRASTMNWRDNDCAMLFQERDCDSCYLSPVTMSNGSNISTDHSLQFYAAVVRENCFLNQEIDAFSRMWRFQNIKQPILYKGAWAGTLKSAYQSDPEKFSCVCGDSLPTTPSSPVPVNPSIPSLSTPAPPLSTTQRNDVEPVTKSSKINLEEEGLEGAAVLVGGLILILVFVFAVYLAWDKLPSWSCQKTGTDVVNTDQQQQQHNDKDFTRMTNEFNKVCIVGNIVARTDFDMTTSDLENPLGKGRFGIVYQATLKQDPDGLNETVAVKKVKWSGSDTSVVRSYLREVKTFQRIGVGNENIVRFRGACCDKDGLYILTELCEGGSLEAHLLKTMRPQILDKQPPPMTTMVEGQDSYYYTDAKAEKEWMEKTKNPVLTPDQFQQMILWCEQIACGMEYLSLNGIIHSDLASRNVLLKGGIAKICDFGLSMEYFAQTVLTGDFPFNSFAPEFNTENSKDSGNNPTTQVDVWAYGFIILEIFTLGDPLYPHVKEHGHFRFIEVSKLLSEGYRHPKPPLAPDDVYAKMRECWQNVPQDRPSFTYLREFFESKRTEVAHVQED